MNARDSRIGTHLIPATVIEVVMGRNACDDLHAGLFGGSLYLGNVVRVDGSRSVRVIVYEEVGVVVVTDGDGKDLHPVNGGS